MLLFGATAFFGFQWIPLVQSWVTNLLPIDSWFSWGDKVEGFFGKLAMIAVTALSVFLYISTYKFILLTILSPFLAYVSERVEELETGNNYPFSWSQLFKDSLRGMKISLVNFIKEILSIAVLFLVGLIPGVAAASAPLIFLVQSYFVGFSMIDYFLERRRFSSAESMRMVRKLRGLCLPIGAAFNGLLFVPLIGVIIGAPLAAVAAARGMVAMEEKGSSQEER